MLNSYAKKHYFKQSKTLSRFKRRYFNAKSSNWVINSSKKSLAHQNVIDDETAVSQYEFKMSAFSTECAIN